MRKYRDYLILLILILAVLPVWGGRTFNGTSDKAAAAHWPNPINANVNTISFSFTWTQIGAYSANSTLFGSEVGLGGTNNSFVMLFITATVGSCTGPTLLVDMVESGVGDLQVSMPRPAVGTHDYVVYIDTVTPANALFWLDGVAQTTTVCSNQAAGPIFVAASNNPIYFGVRNTSGTFANFASGTLSNFAAYYNTKLTLNDAKQLHLGVSPGRTASGMYTWYCPLYGTDSPEPCYSGVPGPPFTTPNSQPFTLTGTTKSNQNTSGPPVGATRP
jgi:hypothetical protein